ncbi:MAG: prepilin peptidase, partial [Actinomycetia bacterium]|nr:prepilin peptidase [Actinomycetes bacterium]
WLRALLAGVVLGLGYLVLHLLGRGSAIGLGDVKLAPSIGTVLGYQSWEHVYTATMLAFIAGGLAALALVITRRIGLRERFAFGPAMAFGAIVLMAAPLR